MNKMQKIVFLIGILVFVLMGLYPPWIYRIDSLNIHQDTDFGYHFITNAPRKSAPPYAGSSIINIRRLCVQWSLVAVVTCGLVVTLKDIKKEKETGKTRSSHEWR